MEPSLPFALVLLSFCLVPGRATSGLARSVNDPALPGESDYWVKLRGIEVTAGDLDPPFTPDGSFFKLHVPNTHLETLSIRLALDTLKYNLLYIPKIFVDGREMEYTPLESIAVSIPLNDTIGIFDRTVRIKVVDPKTSGNWWSWAGERSHEYAIQILQPPEFGNVVRAHMIRVTGEDGAEIASTPQFSPDSERHTFRFHLKGADTRADLQVRCSDYATGMTYDGRRVSNGATKQIIVKGALSETLVQCSYDASQACGEACAGVQNVMERTYRLAFTRTVPLSSTHMELRLMGEDGFCERRDWADPRRGFVCRADVRRPKFVAIYNNSDADVALIDGQSGSRFWLPNGLRKAVPIVPGTSNHTLRMAAGAHRLDYPVAIIWPAPCHTLHCPSGQVNKKGLSSAPLARQRMCRNEECSEEDAEHCCEDAARCNTFRFACPLNGTVRHDGERFSCKAATCQEGDNATCCVLPDAFYERRRRKETAETRDGKEYQPGVIRKVNKDGTYAIEYAGGAEEREVPAKDVLETGSVDNRTNNRTDKAEKPGERVDVRVYPGGLTAGGSKEEEEEAKAKLFYYQAVGCGPVPAATCRPADAQWQKVGHGVPVYESNGLVHHRCFYDETCSLDRRPHGGIGCNAGGRNQNCRFCGFHQYLPCPEAHDCSIGAPLLWTRKKQVWCCRNFFLGCFYGSPTMVYRKVLREFDESHQRMWSSKDVGTRVALVLSLLAGLAGIASLVAAFATTARMRCSRSRGCARTRGADARPLVAEGGGPALDPEALPE